MMNEKLVDQKDLDPEFLLAKTMEEESYGSQVRQLEYHKEAIVSMFKEKAQQLETQHRLRMEKIINENEVRNRNRTKPRKQLTEMIIGPTKNK